MKRQGQKLASRFLNRIQSAARRLFIERAESTARSTRQTTRRLAVETLDDRRVLAAAFFAPPETSGTVNVQLVPLANVAAGVPEIVTFGVPFTRGSVTQNQLSQLR